MPTHPSTAKSQPAAELERRNLTLLRRSLDHVRGDGAQPGAERAVSAEEQELRLELMLLREENARLRADRRQPTDLGVVIRQLRQLAGDAGDQDAADDVFAALAEVLVIRTEVDAVCVELEAALAAVRGRLARLSSTWGLEPHAETETETGTEDHGQPPLS